MRQMDNSADETITYDEFVEYYCNISSNYKSDDDFQAYLNSTW